MLHRLSTRRLKFFRDFGFASYIILTTAAFLFLIQALIYYIDSNFITGVFLILSIPSFLVFFSAIVSLKTSMLCDLKLNSIKLHNERTRLLREDKEDFSKTSS